MKTISINLMLTDSEILKLRSSLLKKVVLTADNLNLLQDLNTYINELAKKQ
jgi:hypothetical protein